MALVLVQLVDIPTLAALLNMRNTDDKSSEEGENHSENRLTRLHKNGEENFENFSMPRINFQ